MAWASARMLETARRAMLTLVWLRYGDQQVVTVRSGPYSSLARPRSGARTPEGLKRWRRATSKHDGRSAEVITLQRLRGEARRQRQHLCALIRQAEAVLDQPAGG